MILFVDLVIKMWKLNPLNLDLWF